MENLASVRARVKLFKYIFLSGGVCILLGLLGTVYIKNSHNVEEPTEEGGQKTSSILTKDFTLSINSSIFEGISSDLVPYKISANNVTKTTDDKYILNSVKGTYSLVDGELIIKAKNGTLDESTKFITLKNDVQITLYGAIFTSQEMKINLDSKDAHSNTNVEVIFEQSNITADKFKTENSGDQIKFEGNIESSFTIKDFN